MADMQSDGKMHWYVIHTLTGEENRVVQRLQERIKDRGVDEMFDQIVVPTEEVVEMRAGQKHKSSRKFFPSYVLLKMTMDANTWHFVKS